MNLARAAEALTSVNTNEERKGLAPIWGVAAIFFALWAVWLFFGILSLRSWKNTKAEVINVVTVGRARSSTGILYRYEVDGKSYECDRQAYVPHSLLGNLKAGRRSFNRYVYKPGNFVAISYDPAHPEVAAIDTSTYYAWSELMTLVFLIAGFGTKWYRDSHLE